MAKSRLNLIKELFFYRERMEARQRTNTLEWAPWYEELDSPIDQQADIQATINRTPDWTSAVTAATFDHRQADITEKGLEALEEEAALKKEDALRFKAQFKAAVICEEQVNRRLEIDRKKQAKIAREQEELEEIQAAQWAALERAQAGLPAKEPTTKELLAIKIAQRQAERSA